MKTFNIVLAVLVTASITACPAKTRISLENASPYKFDVAYGTVLVVVAPGTSIVFDAFIGSQNLKIVTEFACYDYGIPFASLPGDFYRPGMRHTVSLAIGAKFELIVRPYKDKETADIVITGKPCDQTV